MTNDRPSSEIDYLLVKTLEGRKITFGIPSERICFEGILETAGHNLMNVQLQYEIYDEIESYLARSSAERKSIHEHDRRMNITQRLFPYRKYQIALTPEEKKKFNSSKSI